MVAADSKPSVVIVGGGFAGVGCAKELAKHDVPVVLLDRNNYHQFQPLLYQVATAELSATDVARSLRAIFRRDETVSVKQLSVTSCDPATLTVTTEDGQTFTGDYLVLAAGSRPNFFAVPGAAEHAFPLYSLRDAKALRTRLFEVFEEADTNPARIEQGALNIVIVGAGPTGVETAGAVADLVRDVLPKRFHDLPVGKTRIFLVDHGKVVLRAFSEKAHAYAAEKLEHNGVTLLLETGVDEVMKDRVVLSNGHQILSRASSGPAACRARSCPQAPVCRRSTAGGWPRSLTSRVDGHPRVYAIGDMAVVTDADGEVDAAARVGGAPGRPVGGPATSSPTWTASAEPFSYRDKGIMAMIGSGSAIAEVGRHHHELHGHVGFAAWLGVHAWLMSGVRQRVDAFVAWAWDFFFSSRSSSIIDDPDAAHIDWGDDDDEDDDVRDADL